MVSIHPTHFFPIGFFARHNSTCHTKNQQVMPDDHSKLVPLLPIPNRTVKQLRADDSAATSVKVGHRQAFIPHTPVFLIRIQGFCFMCFSYLLRNELNMSDFILSKGTLVKFGCVSTSLYSFLRNGIASDIVRSGFKLDIVNEETEYIKFNQKIGLYVGELAAYFDACSEFCEQTNKVHAINENVLNKFVNALHNNHEIKPSIEGLEKVSSEVGLPIVLEIQLMEDCIVLADEQYEDSNSVERSWKLWRSVVINRNEGIPVSWIQKFYFPRLLDYKDVTEGSNTRVIEQTVDSALMVGGLMQAKHKDTPGDLLFAFKKQYGRINFSQSMRFDENSLERFFNLNSMIDPATRIINQMNIWQDVTALAKKQGIELK